MARDSIAWTVNGVSAGQGRTTARLTCAACRKSFLADATTMAGAFLRLDVVLRTHIFEEHKEEPARPHVADPLMACGNPGFQAGDGPCSYERGHEGPCQWGQGG
jgi:hypothetical protein